MKKNIKWFCTILFFFSTYLSNAQGSDIIICIDNSGSINSTEFRDMTISINTIILDVLECNNQNRISVIHYGGALEGQASLHPRIFIESDFTNDLATAQDYTRRLFGGDFLHESMVLIGDALDNNANLNIVSPQTQLNTNPLNSLVVFLFTDALRDTGQLPIATGIGSYLVNSTNTAMSTNNAFQVFTDFKNNRGTTFVVVHYPPDPESLATGASIASLGGTYNGPLLETYPADPDNNLFPRFYFDTTDFLLNDNDLTNITADLCNISNPIPDPCNLEDLNIEVIGNNLIWDDIATSYQLEFYSDGECSTDIGTLLTTSYTITNNNFNNIHQVINILGTKSFRFRIKTNCSDWSHWCCLTPLDDSTYILTNNCIPSNPCDNYDDFINIVDEVQAGTIEEYITYFDIEASNTIQSGATSTYKASNSIILKPGFYAENGSLFNAYIDDCIITNENKTIVYSNDADNFPNKQNLRNVETNLGNNIIFHPNPVNNKLNITLAKGKINSFNLHNIQGQLVKTANNIQVSKYQIDISNLARGMYLLKITLDDNSSIIKKIILE